RRPYAAATNLQALAQQQNAIVLLDICYGLGYNTAAALEAIWAANPDCEVTVIGLELDPQVPKAAIAQNLTQAWPEPVQPVLQALADKGQVQGRCQGQLWIGDARQQIQTLVDQGWRGDRIFLDPFSPPRCPQLWTVEFLSLVAQCLKPEGILATYSCAAAVRAGLQLAGLHLRTTRAVGRKWPATIARWIDQDLPPLSHQELEHLQTRAAVPYRDPTLRDSAAAILERRSRSQATSDLASTALWRKRWLA
ncbi:MAG: MnmC family methyltransferase, partial [Cyanobacteria bacterium]|nr:MnmC family methyltransferase [Cyanobacteriota bacterium]